MANERVRKSGRSKIGGPGLDGSVNLREGMKGMKAGRKAGKSKIGGPGLDASANMKGK